jgi:sulfide:quinone oxidoreductase
MRILVLGAGFGGVELTSRLSDVLGDAADIVLVDKADGFVFGFSKLDVMFGRTTPDAVRHLYRDVVKPGVRFVQSTIRAIDPVRRRLRHPRCTGLLRRRAGDHRCHLDTVQCPPAPSETALMLHDFLVDRGLRSTSEILLVMPLGTPIPPSPAASAALLTEFAERGISWHPETLVRGLDAERRVAVLANGEEMPFDLFLGVPTHRVPAVVRNLGCASTAGSRSTPLPSRPLTRTFTRSAT